MSKPTQEAEQYFEYASMWADRVVRGAMEGKNDSNNIASIAMALTNVAYGLAHLSVGMRATYMKLEEIERQLKLPRR